MTRTLPLAALALAVLAAAGCDPALDDSDLRDIEEHDPLADMEPPGPMHPDARRPPPLAHVLEVAEAQLELDAAQGELIAELRAQLEDPQTAAAAATAALASELREAVAAGSLDPAQHELAAANLDAATHELAAVARPGHEALLAALRPDQARALHEALAESEPGCNEGAPLPPGALLPRPKALFHALALSPQQREQLAEAIAAPRHAPPPPPSASAQVDLVASLLPLLDASQRALLIELLSPRQLG
ncbi:hypothetical protein G6O69_17780 [Pseudenhygromyxa sp. WMMC2535]|uniref:hypothetical protein n=1 Tax=Pseudenhygromyxa sp. WMMC2535 TaxID=2712867 RepID=UPI001557D776|nr:hypothetical protein [Pseudenhygromyxa sp. WMMC2535]NVB39698.1 hypothetical protein [Pseudenhygromyxa sp. WMMC2535]